MAISTDCDESLETWLKRLILGDVISKWIFAWQAVLKRLVMI